MKIEIVLLILSIFFYQSKSLNINITNPLSTSIAALAGILVDIPSAKFPFENFLKYVLYDHIIPDYTYKDFLNLYGVKTNNLYAGNLVIGNDSILGGIVSSTADSVIINVPNDVIQKVPFYLLPKYFPKGYTILQATYDNLYSGASGSVQGTFQGKAWNFQYFYFFQKLDSALFYVDKPLNIWVSFNPSNYNPYISAFGYISEWDNSSSSGKFIIQYYWLIKGSTFDPSMIFFTNNIYDNSVTISKSGSAYKIYGSIMLDFSGSTGYYSFYGTIS